MKAYIPILSILIFGWACGGSNDADKTGNTSVKSGEQLFKTNCAICHGDDGRKGLTGAKIIPDSQLNVKERIMLITKGKGNMMPYAGLLSKEEIEAVANYTTTLK